MATIASVTVGLVDQNGGGEFTITGVGLAKAVRVYFVDAASKAIPATRYTVVSDTKITGICPAFSAVGPARVNVTVGEFATAAQRVMSGLGMQSQSGDVNELYVGDQNFSMKKF
ncbi:hypothetical protein PAQ31011_03048 [Pandoraea aquatica]|uniref:IPT/TIG domain-containing protein n=1 Tax=Pandoraea aquatica TaxID=2508290 RepID=A0A5E4W499_9BURK|nr:IPT/TIG domain-containing protein [Pandoraea aquatica]VVE18983.1 hypothetical protein PAQ31011_03048 [Pandoraea aquatica]